MFVIVLSAVVTFGWAAAGILTLKEPAISHLAYACTWGAVLVWSATMMIQLIVSYARKRHNGAQKPN